MPDYYSMYRGEGGHWTDYWYSHGVTQQVIEEMKMATAVPEKRVFTIGVSVAQLNKMLWGQYDVVEFKAPGLDHVSIPIPLSVQKRPSPGTLWTDPKSGRVYWVAKAGYSQEIYLIDDRGVTTSWTTMVASWDK